MVTQKTWGRWLRVELEENLLPHSQQGKEHPRLINLDYVAQVKPASYGTRFCMADGSFIDTNTDFEVAACALMLSEGPMPPQPRPDPQPHQEVSRSEFGIPFVLMPRLGGSGL